MSTELTAQDEAIAKSMALSGQAAGTRIPFIPILKINNTKEIKQVAVDGVMQEVEVSAKKGFKLTRKDGDSYQETLLEGDLSGIILKERFFIQKKWKEDDPFPFKSREFDDWSQQIEVFDSKTSATIFTGTYDEIKAKFSSQNEEGETVRTYGLFVVLYLNVGGEVMRLQAKMSGNNPWFEYKGTFGENEPWAGILTHFKLEQVETGKIKFWAISYEKGEAVDLAKNLDLQIEISKFFKAVKEATETKPFDQAPVPTDDDYIPQDTEKDINLASIPF